MPSPFNIWPVLSSLVKIRKPSNFQTCGKRGLYVVGILISLIGGTLIPSVEAQTTTRVSVDSNGAQGNGDSGSRSRRATISADGNVVAFPSDSTNLVSDDINALRDLFVHNRQSGQTTRVSVGPGGIESDDGNVNAGSRGPSLSEDGRFVAWESAATNLVAGDSNGVSDIFVHDTQSGVDDSSECGFQRC